MNTENETRIVHLESRLRRQQAVSPGGLLMAVAALAWTWKNHAPTDVAMSTTVEANRFVLKDAKGNQRGVWEVAERYLAHFQLLNGTSPRR